MLKNEKGFSLVELLAIIFISSVVIWPLMFQELYPDIYSKVFPDETVSTGS